MRYGHHQVTAKLLQTTDLTFAFIFHLPHPPLFPGITNQRESAVAWSRKTGKPLCRLIVWDDARTKNTVAHFEHKLKSVGIEAEPGVFKKGDEGVEALRQL